MKKHFLLLVLSVLLILPAFGQEMHSFADLRWDRELEVETGQQRFDDNTHYAYIIEIFNTRDNFVKKLWKDQLKNSCDKIKRDVAYGARLSIHSDPVDMYTTYDEDKRSGYVTMSVSFLHNGNDINPDDYPDAHRKAKEMMYDMAVLMNKAVVNEQIETANNELGKMQKDLEKLRKENDKLHQSIAKNQSDLEKAVREEKGLEKDVKAQEKDIDQFEEKAGEARSTDELKKLSKMQKNLTRLQDKLNRNKSNQIKYEQNVREAEQAIPINEQEQIAKEKEIEAQEEKLNRLQTMYREVS